ncbi:hypothetical protein Mal52_50150 [Symmachiella dynata]|uniref:RiboL-PSP-HEPN domain-containing protein n=1 Tax=Symmachiella dynata TaxID=2527995 RepID=A0A517ZVI2_9PLAN|nr:hypothetical protein [Symmachiella dynata]QDU46494.1 hypothetical protein Mal52_50150 [Symmachiella dynata]
MPLVDDIDQLRNDTVAALNDAHDYYWNTSAAWRLVQNMVHQGRSILIKNAPTGSTIRGPELSLLGQKYVASYLSSATFQHFIALFEWFAVDFMKLWLRAHPGSLGKQQVDVATILTCHDKSEIVERAIEKRLLDVAYGPITKWMNYIEQTTGISCLDSNQVQRLSEIKASRDLLAHNNGIVNSLYRERAGDHARFHDGDTLELPAHYHRESWEFIRQTVNDIADAGIDKMQS